MSTERGARGAGPRRDRPYREVLVLNPIALAIPGFMAAIVLELAVARRRGADVYRFGDSVASLSCGVLQQLLAGVLALGTVAAYAWVHAELRVMDLAPSAWTWALLFVLVDLCYYWFHRASHEVGFLWAAHAVHHQSEEYNLTTALRQSALQPGFSWVFYLPLAVLGFPPSMFVVMVALNTLYQFWIHTRLIERLGPLEWVLNTPSHHRVHHGQNEEYRDRNHGGTLIVWDRLFGTFAPERAPVVYGVTEPLCAFEPLTANVQVWRAMARRAREAERAFDRVAVWFRRPGWTPPGARAPKAHDASKYAPPTSRGTVRYVALQLALVLLGTEAYLWLGGAPPPSRALLAFAVASGTVSLGALLDGAAWARSLEAARLCTLPLLVLALPAEARPLGAVACASWVVLSAAALFGLRRDAARRPADGAPADADRSPDS
jgi:alkylglycerol monooxygenase